MRRIDIDNEKELIKCIKLHNKICAVNEKVNDMLSIIFLARAFWTSVLICTMCFLMITDTDIVILTQYSFYTAFVFFQLVIPCYYGEKITEMSNKISQTVAHSEWMLEGKKYQQSIIIMIEFFNKPMKITSFGLFDINMENYGRVCEWAYSLFTLFLHLYKN
ncbi:hypothetical protein PVAND_013810 [Polypedilum vanderplanki]|uniref:Odorant receptor n=1 Tax=Polypedilum vanderplanki TaxID=319348 RepID=A0A9J6CQU3_POLVA|nr:hypothetical protein PVAND_013810 [Polypedilum vanderplanki]